MSSAVTSYTFPVFASLLLHGLLITLVVVGWVPDDKPRQTIKPRYIEAKLLQLEPRVTQPKPKVDQAAAARAEQQRQEQVRKERARQEQVRKEQQAKAEAEKKRQQEIARKAREQKERERQEQQRREREEQVRRQRESELARALESEEEFLDAAVDEEQVGTYSDYIFDRVVSNWSRPPSARRGMIAILEIQLVPTGRVVGVTVVKSSGNSAFDLSAEQAVRKVEQFDRLKDMDPSLFERNFRRFRLEFRPEDLRL